MNKLLIVTTIPDTLDFFLPLTKHLRSQGWRVDAMAKELSTSKEYLQFFDRVWDVEWSRNPLDPKNLISAPAQIRQAFLQEQYDLVNVSTPVAAFVTRYALNNWRKQGKVKVIYTAQGFHFYEGGAPHKNAIFLGLEKIAGSGTDYLVVVNRQDEAAAKRYGLIAAERVHYIPGTGLNLDRFNPHAISETEINRVREELGLAPENPLFLSVAEFILRKRPWDILKALAKLERPQVHLAFAGNGRILEEMQQLASELGIQKQVHFLGVRRDIPVLMRASVATLIASDQEGLPNCVMESLCMEVPVIGTEIRGTRDLLKDGNGLLVKLGDVKEIAKAMAWILDHPKEAQEMGKRGREDMVNYDVPHILELYGNLYSEALSN
ncbi:MULTISPECIES: glycosyltransferase [unclassified Microcoleus]|uniref:glycosyltransferase n=1 Tax=unclassified Microcoleus TaxID=2642155 RepID=UPI002FCF112A